MKRALCLVLLGFGCDDHAPPRPPRGPPRPVALRPGPSAVPAASPEESPATTADDDPLGRCVRRNRDALGPELGRALGALQDDALLEDACALDLAVRARAPERCASVRLSVLREACALRASIAAARPEACPAAPGLRGRDPVCVALAARSVALCGAAAPLERARCLALAARDPGPCEALDPLLRPTCARDLEPLRAVLPALVRVAPLAPEASRNAWSNGTEDARVETPLPWLLRGIFLDESGILWVVDPAIGWPSPRALALDRAVVGVRVPSHRGRALALDGTLALPGRPTLTMADATLRAVVTLTHAPHQRGGRAAGIIVFDGTTAGGPIHAELRFDTFVRDVVMAAALR